MLGALEPLSPEKLREALRIQGSSYKTDVKTEQVKRLYMNFLYEDVQGNLQFNHNSARTFVSNMTVKDALGSGTDEAKQFTEKINHLHIAELYIDLMKSSAHPYWQHTFLEPSMWEDPYMMVQNMHSIDLYLSENGLEHCSRAAEKQSMFDPLWAKVLDDVILPPTSAFAFIIVTRHLFPGRRPPATSPAETLRCALGENEGHLELLYSHALAFLNIVDEDDVCRLQLSGRQTDVSSQTHEEVRQHALFKHTACVGGLGKRHGLKVEATALHLACYAGNHAAVQIFLQATHHLYGETGLVKILSQPGAPRFIFNYPFCMALQDNNVRIAKTLLNFEKNHLTRTSSVLQWSLRCASTERPALCLAAQYLDEEETLHLLYIVQPADIDASDEYGRTALHVAAGYGRFKLVDALKSTFKANFDAEDKYGQTPSVYAEFYSGSPERKMAISVHDHHYYAYDFPWGVERWNGDDDGEFDDDYDYDHEYEYNAYKHYNDYDYDDDDNDW